MDGRTEERGRKGGKVGENHVCECFSCPCTGQTALRFLGVEEEGEGEGDLKDNNAGFGSGVAVTDREGLAFGQNGKRL